MKLSHDVILYITGVIAVVGIITSSYLVLEIKDRNQQIEGLLQERNTLLQKNNQP